MQQITANVKIFVSQPMNGLTVHEIGKTMSYYMEKLSNKFPNAEFISAINDTYKDAEEVNRIDCLGRSITAMSNADFITFLPGWAISDGCQIERNVADRYKIMVIQPHDYLSQSELNKYFDEDREIENDYYKRNKLNYCNNEDMPVAECNRRY